MTLAMTRSAGMLDIIAKLVPSCFVLHLAWSCIVQLAPLHRMLMAYVLIDE